MFFQQAFHVILVRRLSSGPLFAWSFSVLPAFLTDLYVERFPVWGGLWIYTKHGDSCAPVCSQLGPSKSLGSWKGAL